MNEYNLKIIKRFLLFIKYTEYFSSNLFLKLELYKDEGIRFTGKMRFEREDSE